MKNQEFSVISEYPPIKDKKGIPIENLNLEDDYVYLQSSKIKDLKEIIRLRKCYKIHNRQNNKYILRKIKAKSLNGLDSGKILINYPDTKELKIEGNSKLTIEKAGLIQKHITYYTKHPKQEIRLGYIFFSITLIISIVSLIVSIIK